MQSEGHREYEVDFYNYNVMLAWWLLVNLIVAPEHSNFTFSRLAFL